MNTCTEVSKPGWLQPGWDVSCYITLSLSTHATLRGGYRVTHWGQPAKWNPGSWFAAISIIKQAFCIFWSFVAKMQQSIESVLDGNSCFVEETHDLDLGRCRARALLALVCCFFSSRLCSIPRPLPQDRAGGDRGVRIRRLHWYQSPFITHSSALWSRSQTAQESYSPVWQWGGGWSELNSVFGQSAPIWNYKKCQLSLQPGQSRGTAVRWEPHAEMLWGGGG